jgi:hypothetical protein
MSENQEYNSHTPISKKVVAAESNKQQHKTANDICDFTPYSSFRRDYFSRFVFKCCPESSAN